MMKESTNVMDLFENNGMVKICAPMVRYSKLQFRNLVRSHGCDLCFTPMILADSFCKSAKARQNEFTTNLIDTALITQFAANTVHDFVGAAHLVSPYCDGVDLNCGCPQRWARQMGLGCSLLDRPELICDMVQQCRNQICKPFTVSVKTRLSEDPRKTIEIARQLEKSGVSFLTIHARTPNQLTGDIDAEALKLVAENVGIPVVANGGLKSLDECHKLSEFSGCKGVMVANALLTNPTLFSGCNVTALECVQKWLNICYNTTLNSEEFHAHRLGIPEKPRNITFQCFHHHLVFMLEKILSRKQRQIFNNLQKFSDVLDFIDTNLGLRPQLYSHDEFDDICTLNLDYSERDTVYSDLKPVLVDRFEDLTLNIFDNYNPDDIDGKYFKDKLSGDSGDSCDWSDIFLENG